MAITYHVDTFIDAKGMMCPMPVLTLAKTIRTMQSGQIVAMAATDYGAIKDVPAWSNKTGNELLETVEENGVTTFYIKKA